MYPKACLNNQKEGCDIKNGFSNSCTDQNGTSVRCRLCGTCQQGYKRRGSGTRCIKCPDPTVNKLLLGIGILVMLIGSSIMIWIEITGETSADETVGLFVS